MLEIKDLHASINGKEILKGINRQRIIIAHELGHAVLHSDSAISAFHEFTMFDDTDRMEYEAVSYTHLYRNKEPTILENESGRLFCCPDWERNPCLLYTSRCV